jgi:hypothetical protein
MAIRILNRPCLLGAFILLVGCEKWSDGVVNEIEFPDHEATTAASCILTTGDSKAILSVTNTASLLSVAPVDLPQGVSATLQHEGVMVLSWTAEDVALVGEGLDVQKMLVLNLDSPLNLPEGEIELTVTIPGEPLLTARAIQPGMPEVSYTLHLGADTIASLWGSEILDEVGLDLINHSGLRDVYAVRLQEAYVYGDTVWSLANGSGFEDPRLDYVSSCGCWIVDDQNVDAQVLSDMTLSRIRWSDEYGYEGGEEAPLRLVVEQLDPSLGEFYKSVSIHEAAQDNPFANPSGVYSNTSSGYGHFGLAARRTILLN